MIWPELWLCVLAVVLRKHRTRQWVNRTVNSTTLPLPHYKCWCVECVNDFEPFFQWVRIR